MTPEAKAREIALRLVGNPYGIDESDVEFIAQALRDVERETLERAAKAIRTVIDPVADDTDSAYRNGAIAALMAVNGINSGREGEI